MTKRLDSVDRATRTLATEGDMAALRRVWLRLFLFGLLYLGFGAFGFCYSLFDRWTYSQLLQHGATATAHINKIAYNGGAFGDPYYIADVTWLDRSGSTRTSRVNLSLAFGQPIARGARSPDISLTYLEDNSHARQLVTGDERELDQIIANNTRWGIGLFVSSLALIVLLYVVKRKRPGKVGSP
jgi:hypothetical protein